MCFVVSSKFCEVKIWIIHNIWNFGFFLVIHHLYSEMTGKPCCHLYNVGWCFLLRYISFGYFQSYISIKWGHIFWYICMLLVKSTNDLIVNILHFFDGSNLTGFGRQSKGCVCALLRVVWQLILHAPYESCGWFRGQNRHDADDRPLHHTHSSVIQNHGTDSFCSLFCSVCGWEDNLYMDGNLGPSSSVRLERPFLNMAIQLYTLCCSNALLPYRVESLWLISTPATTSGHKNWITAFCSLVHIERGLATLIPLSWHNNSQFNVKTASQWSRESMPVIALTMWSADNTTQFKKIQCTYFPTRPCIFVLILLLQIVVTRAWRYR
jgi:hypothetical protein